MSSASPPMIAPPHLPPHRGDGGLEAERPRPPAPLIAPALSLIAGIILGEYGVSSPAAVTRPHAAVLGWSAAILLLSLIAMVAVRVRPWGRALVRVAPIVLLGAVGIGRHAAATHLPAQHLAHAANSEGVLTTLSGEVVSAPVHRPAARRNPFLPGPVWGSSSFVLAAREVRNGGAVTPVCGFVRVRVSDGPAVATTSAVEDLKSGDVVALTGRLHAPRRPRNPGEVDWAAALRLDGIHVSLAVEDARLVTLEHRAAGWLERARQRLRAMSRSALLDAPAAADGGDEPSRRLLEAIVLGQRSATGPQIEEAFVRTGTVHILSVSGFHVGALAGGCWLLFRVLLRRGIRFVALATLLVLALYGAIAEPNSPIVRSLLMAGLACAAGLSGRPVLSLNWLAAAAIAVLLWNPLELFRAGFQLSFVQVLALLWFVPPIYARMTRPRGEGPEARRDADTWRELAWLWVWRFLIGLAIVSVVASITAWPLVMFHFEQITPWGAVQSMLLTPPFALVIVLGYLSVLCGWIPLLGWLLSAMTGGLMRVLLHVVEHLASWPGSWIEVAAPPAALVLATYGGMVGVLAIVRYAGVGGPRMLRAALAVGLSGIVATAWILWSLSSNPQQAGRWQLRLLDVGNGSAMLLTTRGGPAAVFDLGTTGNFDVGEMASKALRRAGVRKLEAVCVSHENLDHYSGLPALLASVPAATRWVSHYQRSLQTEDGGLRLLERLLPRDVPPAAPLSMGDGGAIGDVRYEVLWPPGGLEAAAANERSLVIRLSAGGASILLTGDIERDAMRALVTADREGRLSLRADVLVAPHHGSVAAGTSVTASFYAAVQPRWVLVSTRKARPDLAALVERTLGGTCRLLSTRDVGAIVVTMSDAGAIDVSTPFAAGAAGGSDGADDSQRHSR